MDISTPQWVKDAVFYQIFPDRFAKSNRLNKDNLNLETWDSPPTVYGFKGGDLLGIVEHLDHLVDLGVTAIFLNPIFTSASNHRYHTYDYFNVDPILGGNEAFRELLDQAHARGLRVLLDGVFNHASRGFLQFNHTLESGINSPYVDWFYFRDEQLQRKEPFLAYPTDQQFEELRLVKPSMEILGYRGWYDMPALPKFNIQTPAVREFLWSVAEYWVKFGIDGWRIDVAFEITDDSFWQEFRRRVKNANPEAYIVGEIWYESQPWLQGDQFDAVMNYMLSGAILGFFIDDIEEQIYSVGDYHKYLQPLTNDQFMDRIAYLQNLYDPAINSVMFNLLNSHDTPRFITSARGDESAFRMALLFLFTYPGAPCIFYGDEIGMSGRNDPECRKSMVWDKSRWDLQRLDYVKSCINLRKQYAALRHGNYIPLYNNNGLLAIARQLDEEYLVVVFNINHDQGTMEIEIPETVPIQENPQILFGAVDIVKAENKLKVGVEARTGAVIKIS
ncbi:MAG: glycoside hydrolase family 13 protein [Anaerolineaceae bacterium]|jgi:glycosidase|nr:MAG: glycoside hydrolase family 13 protein [Anaerolineaceae bacterium]